MPAAAISGTRNRKLVPGSAAAAASPSRAHPVQIPAERAFGPDPPRRRKRDRPGRRQREEPEAGERRRRMRRPGGRQDSRALQAPRPRRRPRTRETRSCRRTERGPSTLRKRGELSFEPGESGRRRAGGSPRRRSAASTLRASPRSLRRERRKRPRRRSTGGSRCPRKAIPADSSDSTMASAFSPWCCSVARLA